MGQLLIATDNRQYGFTTYYQIHDNELVDYTQNLGVLTNLDLSFNKLIGQIPEEIGTHVALKSLNLSWNSAEKNPENIGAIMQVESVM